MAEIDVYGIARLLIEEYGNEAPAEVANKIAHYTTTEDSSSIKKWYEIEDAVKEMMQSEKGRILN